MKEDLLQTKYLLVVLIVLVALGFIAFSFQTKPPSTPAITSTTTKPSN